MVSILQLENRCALDNDRFSHQVTNFFVLLPNSHIADYTPTGVFATDLEKYTELQGAFPIEVATISPPPVAAPGEESEPETRIRSSTKPRIELGPATPDDEEAGHPQWIRIAGWTVDPPMMNAIIPACNASETLSTIKFWNAGLCNETFDDLLFALGASVDMI